MMRPESSGARGKSHEKGSYLPIFLRERARGDFVREQTISESDLYSIIEASWIEAPNPKLQFPDNTQCPKFNTKTCTLEFVLFEFGHVLIGVDRFR